MLKLEHSHHKHATTSGTKITAEHIDTIAVEIARKIDEELSGRQLELAAASQYLSETIQKARLASFLTVQHYISPSSICLILRLDRAQTSSVGSC